MGLLTSLITEAQQQAQQSNFQFGMQLGEVQAQRKLAAANALKQIQLQNELELQRQTQLRQQANEERAYEANVRFQQAKERNASEFTKMTVQKGLEGLKYTLGAIERPYNRIFQNPEKYSEETLASIDNYLGATSKVFAGAMGMAASVKNGEKFDTTGFTDQLGKIPQPKIEFSPEYKAYQESKTYRNYNPKGVGATNPATKKTDDALTGWLDALVGYTSAGQNLEQRKKTVDADDLRMAQLGGKDLFSPERKALETSYTEANKWGHYANMNLMEDDSELGQLVKHLNKKGIKTFDPTTISDVGAELYSLGQHPKLTPKDREALDHASYVLTGKYLNDFKPEPTYRMGSYNNWNATGAYSNTPSSGTQKTPSAMGMTPSGQNDEGLENTDE